MAAELGPRNLGMRIEATHAQGEKLVNGTPPRPEKPGGLGGLIGKLKEVVWRSPEGGEEALEAIDSEAARQDWRRAGAELEAARDSAYMYLPYQADYTMLYSGKGSGRFGANLDGIRETRTQRGEDAPIVETPPHIKQILAEVSQISGVSSLPLLDLTMSGGYLDHPSTIEIRAGSLSKYDQRAGLNGISIKVELPTGRLGQEPRTSISIDAEHLGISEGARVDLEAKIAELESRFNNKGGLITLRDEIVSYTLGVVEKLPAENKAYGDHLKAEEARKIAEYAKLPAAPRVERRDDQEGDDDEEGLGSRVDRIPQLSETLDRIGGSANLAIIEPTRSGTEVDIPKDRETLAREASQKVIAGAQANGFTIEQDAESVGFGQDAVTRVVCFTGGGKLYTASFSAIHQDAIEGVDPVEGVGERRMVLVSVKQYETDSGGTPQAAGNYLPTVEKGKQFRVFLDDKDVPPQDFMSSQSSVSRTVSTVFEQLDPPEGDPHFRDWSRITSAISEPEQLQLLREFAVARVDPIRTRRLFSAYLGSDPLPGEETRPSGIYWTRTALRTSSNQIPPSSGE